MKTEIAAVTITVETRAELYNLRDLADMACDLNDSLPQFEAVSVTLAKACGVATKWSCLGTYDKVNRFFTRGPVSFTLPAVVVDQMVGVGESTLSCSDEEMPMDPAARAGLTAIVQCLKAVVL